MLCKLQRSGAISAKHAQKQWALDKLTHLQPPVSTSLRTVYAVIVEYDGLVHDPRVHISLTAKDCVRDLLQLATQHLPYRKVEELQAQLRLVLENHPILLEDGKRSMRLVLISGHQCRCGGDGGVVWSVRFFPSSSPSQTSRTPSHTTKQLTEEYYWAMDDTLTVTQFLSTVFHPVSDVIHYQLELDNAAAVMGQAQCGGVRMAFAKLLKLRSSHA